MKLIIAGSRTLAPNIHVLDWVVSNLLGKDFQKVNEIVSGGCQGVDLCGEKLAELYGIPVERMVAEWHKFGKIAGPIRNKQMAEHADALVLIWDGKSKGSANMKYEMAKMKKPVYELILKGAK